MRSIELPITHRTVTEHGSYGGASRFDIKQHKYAGGQSESGDWGYIEVLEVKNPPDQRAGIVVYDDNSRHERIFYEWENLELALKAFEECRGSSESHKKLPNMPGCKRTVPCGLLIPWFYAIGDEDLVGNYAFPEGLQDDPVFRFGQKFVVYDDETPIIKTCMGTRYVEKISSHTYEEDDKKTYRLVMWDDGTLWNELKNHSHAPRPLVENELWITEAMDKFKLFLSGKTDKFEIEFQDGQKFIGHLAKSQKHPPTISGRYGLKITVKKARKPLCGFHDFEATPECPNIIEAVRQGLAKTNKVAERIQIISINGKKWGGVFYNKP